MNDRDDSYVGRGECPPGRRELLERTGFLARAKARGEEGITSSAQHAEEVQPGWGERARLAIQSSLYLATEPAWTMDFARQWAYACGLDVPPEERAWGAVTQKLVRDGIIEPVGYAPAASSNGSPKRTYRLKVAP